jgi:hypothetical protein
MPLYKICVWWKNFDCIFGFSMKSYVRNTVNLSWAKILLTSVIEACLGRYGLNFLLVWQGSTTCYLITYLHTYSLTHSLTYMFTHSLFHLLTHLVTYLLSHTLTPWSTVLPEKLTGSKVVKKFPAFYGTWRFITASQEPTTCPYPEPDQPIPCPHFLLPKDSSSHYPPI